MVSKSKSCQIGLDISSPVSQFRAAEYEFDIHILRFQDIFKMFQNISRYIYNLFLGKLVPDLKLHQIYLKTCTQEIWKVLNTDLT